MNNKKLMLIFKIIEVFVYIVKMYLYLLFDVMLFVKLKIVLFFIWSYYWLGMENGVKQKFYVDIEENMLF